MWYLGNWPFSRGIFLFWFGVIISFAFYPLENWARYISRYIWQYYLHSLGVIACLNLFLNAFPIGLSSSLLPQIKIIPWPIRVWINLLAFYQVRSGRFKQIWSFCIGPSMGSGELFSAYWPCSSFIWRWNWLFILFQTSGLSSPSSYGQHCHLCISQLNL